MPSQASATTSAGPLRKVVFHKVGENLYRLESSGGYYALFKRNGKQIRRSLKTTDKTLARRRLAAQRAKVDRLNTTTGASKITFADLADRWFEGIKGNLKETSATRVEVCLKGLKPYFRGLPLRNVDHRQIEKWIVKRGQKISPSSYKHERRVMITAFDYAVRQGLILDNPAREEGVLPTRKIAKSKLVIPTREQFRILVETIRKSDMRAIPGANLVELLAYSGMRLQEGLNLTWGDLDWDRNTFAVTGGERGTKNHEVRVVPLFPAMRELLVRIKGEANPSAEDRVIPLAGPNGAATAIKTACRKAKLPVFLHHSLRHYFCSNAIEAGIDFKVIAGWLGHRDGGFLVAKTYGHLRDAHSFEMAARMTFSARDAMPANVVSLPNTGTG